MKKSLVHSDIPEKPVTSISEHTRLSKNNKIHKEGFDAGYKKGYKEGKKQTIVDIIEGRIELPQI